MDGICSVGNNDTVIILRIFEFKTLKGAYGKIYGNAKDGDSVL